MSKTTIRNLIIALILIVTSGAIFSLMVYQTIAQGDQLAVQITTLETHRAQEASYFKLLRLSEETTEDRAQLQSYFLQQESDSIDFLNQVENIAPKVGVTLKTKGLESRVNTADNTEWIQVSFSFAGSREKVQQFIQILETVPYVSKIISAEMRALSSTEWQSEIVIQVQILTYDE